MNRPATAPESRCPAALGLEGVRYKCSLVRGHADGPHRNVHAGLKWTDEVRPDPRDAIIGEVHTLDADIRPRLAHGGFIPGMCKTGEWAVTAPSALTPLENFIIRMVGEVNEGRIDPAVALGRIEQSAIEGRRAPRVTTT